MIDRAEVDHCLNDPFGLGVGAGHLLKTDLLRPDAVRSGPSEHRLGRFAGEEVGGPDESGDECRRGGLVQLSRRGDLFDAPLVEHRDAVAHREGFLLVVGDEEERDADVALDLLELDLHLSAQFEVERPERLIQEQHLRPVHEGPGQRDPLSLAA